QCRHGSYLSGIREDNGRCGRWSPSSPLIGGVRHSRQTWISPQTQRQRARNPNPPLCSPPRSASSSPAPRPRSPTAPPPPPPPGAAVYFIDIKDGAVIPPTTTIHFGLRGMGVAPAGSDKDNAGHHHLIIDSELTSFSEPIPNDPEHLHFGAGQTEAEITLSP